MFLSSLTKIPRDYIWTHLIPYNNPWNKLYYNRVKKLISSLFGNYGQKVRVSKEGNS